VRTAPIGDHAGPHTPEKLPDNGSTHAAAIQSGETLAFSIPEFCRRHGISRAHFYNLWKSGEAPTVMRVGRRTLVSAEAAAKWRMRMEEVARNASTR
jgi:predicted DNA-binding transcriptional regulator AlpA